jgi:hypothetical protein
LSIRNDFVIHGFARGRQVAIAFLVQATCTPGQASLLAEAGNRYDGITGNLQAANGEHSASL